MGAIDERRRLAREGHSDGPWLTCRTVYHYFAQSPFYDPMSNNGVIITQAASGQKALVEAWWQRKKFEAYLRDMKGLEFMVIEPKKSTRAFGSLGSKYDQETHPIRLHR